jgi:adenylate cyclase
MPVEREWRFLVLALPSLRGRKSKRLRQGYLHAEKGLTVRVRIEDDEAKLTIKLAEANRRGPGPQARPEFEYAIPPADARRLMRAADGVLAKRRYRFGRIELDVFEGPLAGLVLAEVEVKGRATRAPRPPAGWTWRDVTRDSRYGNARLAREGLPKGTPRARLG